MDSAMNLEEAQIIKKALEELVPNPNIDFGPSYAMAGKRKEEALKIIRREIKQLKPKPICCCVCGTTKNVRWVGGSIPYLCDDLDCIPF